METINLTETLSNSLVEERKLIQNQENFPIALNMVCFISTQVAFYTHPVGIAIVLNLKVFHCALT